MERTAGSGFLRQTRGARGRADHRPGGRVEKAMHSRRLSYVTMAAARWKHPLIDVRFDERLPSASMFDSATKNLIIIDDLMAETDERVTTFFTKKVITGTSRT